MDSNFGVGLRNYLFKQNTSLTHGEINTRIYEQVQKYLPYIEVLDVVFNSSEDEYDASQLGIKVYFEVIPLGVQDLISIDAVKTASSF